MRWLFPMGCSLLFVCGGFANEAPPLPLSGTVTAAGDAETSTVPERFRQPDRTFEYSATLLREDDQVRIYDVTFPSPVVSESDRNNTIPARYFQPKTPGPHPGVVVLHILGGGFELSQLTANTLARNGVAAVYIKLPYYGERRGPGPRRLISLNANETLESMTQAVLDIRRTADWLAMRNEVDPQRMGITGISLGGIMSALGGAIEPRFKKVAVYLGGGGLAEMVWANPHPSAEIARQAWQDAGGTRESFIQTMAPIDPVTYGRLLIGRDVLMVSAANDRIVPPEAAKRLWNAIGQKPKLVWLDSGHISAGLYLYGEMRRITQFFANDDGWNIVTK